MFEHVYFENLFITIIVESLGIFCSHNCLILFPKGDNIGIEVNNMDYIKVSEVAKKWGISPRRISKLCEENRIEGVIRKEKLYMIPADTSKPEDRRTNQKRITAVLKSIDRKLQELSSRRPLTEGEVQRLQEQFLIEYTYNSNAIEGNTLTLQETA